MATKATKRTTRRRVGEMMGLVIFLLDVNGIHCRKVRNRKQIAGTLLTPDQDVLDMTAPIPDFLSPILRSKRHCHKRPKTNGPTTRERRKHS